MKRKIITLVLAMAATSVFSTTAMAADEINGFYDIGAANSVVITPYAGDTQVTASEKNIAGDDANEIVYVDSNRMAVAYSGATSDVHYGVILVEGSGLPTKDTEIFYINQETAASSNVNFNVYPKLPEETTDMTLYISSSAEGADLVSVPMSYAVNATETIPGPAYALGDANEDNIVDVGDVVSMRQDIAGGYGVEVNEAVADVNKDDVFDVGDVVYLRQYIAGGYGIEL